MLAPYASSWAAMQIIHFKRIALIILLQSLMVAAGFYFVDSNDSNPFLIAALLVPFIAYVAAVYDALLLARFSRVVRASILTLSSIVVTFGGCYVLILAISSYKFPLIPLMLFIIYLALFILVITSKRILDLQKRNTIIFFIIICSIPLISTLIFINNTLEKKQELDKISFAADEIDSFLLTPSEQSLTNLVENLDRLEKTQPESEYIPFSSFVNIKKLFHKYYDKETSSTMAELIDQIYSINVNSDINTCDSSSCLQLKTNIDHLSTECSRTFDLVKTLKESTPFTVDDISYQNFTCFNYNGQVAGYHRYQCYSDGIEILVNSPFFFYPNQFVTITLPVLSVFNGVVTIASSEVVYKIKTISELEHQLVTCTDKVNEQKDSIIQSYKIPKINNAVKLATELKIKMKAPSNE